MKSNCFFRVIIFLFCLIFCSSVFAASISENEAQNWVESKGRQLLSAFGEPDIAKKYAMLDDMFLRYIDLDYVSRFVMGKYWRHMDIAQQASYRELFNRYALSVYKGFPLDFDSSAITFEVTKVMPDDKGATVRSKVNFKTDIQVGQPQLSDIMVDFKLIKNGNEIKITDLKLGESSLILSYRSRFYEMIAKNDDDIEWFLEDLKDITDAAERANAERLRQTEY